MEETFPEDLFPREWAYSSIEPSRIRRLLAELGQKQSFDAVFIRSIVRNDDVELKAAWKMGVRALRKAHRQYSTGDQAFRESLALFQQPRLLAACQAATVAGDAPLVVAAALAHDGSPESHDALMAEFERARAADGDWALRYKLNRLTKYAKKNAHWQAFSGAIAREISRRETGRQPNSCAARLGLKVELLELHFWLHGGVDWLTVWISDKRGQCDMRASAKNPPAPRDVRKLGEWIQAYAKKHRLDWNWPSVRVTTNARGKERAALLAWLRGERERPSISR